MHAQSVEDPASFWGDIAEKFHWKMSPTKDNFLSYNFNVNNGPIEIKWMCDGKLNICYNALDRHLDKKGCKFANVLKTKGVRKGDRVAIYMPMISELVIAMLACARIGAVHSIIFGGYSADSLSARILDAKARVLVTGDGVYRGKKLIHLLEVADTALNIVKTSGHEVEVNIVVCHLPRLNENKSQQDYDETISKSWQSQRDVWWHDVMKDASEECEC